MRHITFKIRHGSITAHDERVAAGRREWTVSDQVDFYLLGSFKPAQWSSAANLAMNICQEMNIPISQLKTVEKGRAAAGRKVDPSQKTMF